MKTRTGAQRLTVDGKVRVNREKVLVARHAVKLGDVLTVGLPHGTRVLKVLAPGARRGSPSEAAALFEDLTPPEEPKPEAGARNDPGPRPNKRDRRALMALKKGASEDISGDGE